MTYVAVSRGRYDAQIYTNDKTQLADGLGRDGSGLRWRSETWVPHPVAETGASECAPERQRYSSRENCWESRKPSRRRFLIRGTEWES
jgi:hypothetical protein